MLIRAIVVDNKDPTHRGRLKIRAYGWHDDIPDNDLPWAEPCMPFGGDKDYGMFFIPEVGSTVWVSFEVDDTFKPNPMCPVWVGVWWGQGEVPPESRDGTYKTHVIKTKKGHKIVISDDSDTVVVQTSQGDIIKMDGQNKSISVETQQVLVKAQGINAQAQTFSLSDKNGTINTTSWTISGNVMIQGTLIVAGGIQSIGSLIAQGGVMTSPSGMAVFMDDLVNKFNTHTHTDSQGGSTGVPDKQLP